jgi:asparagine synthase (glutamine-hydrolysing)
MADRLAHRGPDDTGFYQNPTQQLAFAFRRLSIIDLDTGSQPLTDETGSLHLICNGEIYNFQTLRTQLTHQDHQFKTKGDIEPIIHLYQQQGLAFLNHLDGFFSLALYDSQNEKLILAVDPMGKKPLYYGLRGDFLVFASELKAITSAFPETSIENSALVDYLRFGYIPAPATIYKNTFKLSPGCVLELDLNELRQKNIIALPPAHRYYQPDRQKFTGQFDAACSELSMHLNNAVTKRLVADVPVGVLLSGGLDSSIITALAARTSSSPIRTFSVGFRDELYNELPLARLVAEKYKTDHTELLVEPDITQILDLAVNLYDEPFADSSAIPTYLICREAAKHVKVVLTGDGGDEAFCGYDRYRGFAITSFLAKLKMRPVGSFFEQFLPWPGPEQRSRKARIWRMIRALRYSPAVQYSMLMRIFYEGQLKSVMGPELKAILQSHPDLLAECIDSQTDTHSMIEKANTCDIRTYLPGDLLVKVDRASMACSIETRSPMLDHALIEFAQSLPVSMRCDLFHGKKILRNAFGHLLPDELLQAPKRGFGVPMGNWLRGPLRSQMESILNRHCRLLSQGLADPMSLVRLQAEHIAGLFDHSARLWSLLVLETFLQKH